MDLPPLNLDPTECHRIQLEMKATIDAFMEHNPPKARESNALSDGFKVYSHKRGAAKLYTRRAENSSLNEVLILDTTPMALNDIADIYYSDSNDVFRVEMAILYDDHFLDAAILHTSFAKSEFDAYQWFGVKYKKFNITGTTFADSRDAVYFEYMGMTYDKYGNRTLFLMRDSTYMASFPAQPRSVRNFIKAVYLFTELASENVVDTIQLAFSDPSGSIPSFIFNKQLVRYASAASRMPYYLQQKRLVVACLGTRPRRMTEGRICSSCNAKINGFKARYNCRACGDVVCGNCIVAIARPIASKIPPAIVKDDYCKCCFVGVSSSSRGNSLSPRSTSAPMSKKFSFTDRATHPSEGNSASPTPSSSSSGSQGHNNPHFLQEDINCLYIPDKRNDPFKQMQESLETQKILVSKMKERLNKPAYLTS
ncbi:hypothetical protein THRCLA_12061 [Thraustotheca clavata]|uniref:FYVE zinc finger domain-containing protein n=1 Tax=Thraustotheca clavata TaxID=74557 RepID=A0A1V9Y407_9STRA|nr:hypothetical protein THRCLA_12061 [Thraustotheca clavata]